MELDRPDPARAVADGAISAFGYIDPTDGGETHRYSLSTDVAAGSANTSSTRANAYFVLDYALNLFSNFTYFLDDPDNGDQFEQADRRNVVRRPRDARAAEHVGAAGTPRTRSACRCGTTASAPVGLYHTDGAPAAVDDARGPGRSDDRSACSRRTNIEWTPCRADDARAARRRLSLRRRRRTTRQLRQRSTSGAGQPQGRRSSSARGAAPSSTSTPAPAFTATTRAAPTITRRSRHRRAGRSRRLRWCARRGAEFGVRTVRVPQVQTTVAVWTLGHRLRAALRWRCRHDRGERGRAAASASSGPHYARPRPWLRARCRRRHLAWHVHRRRSRRQSDSRGRWSRSSRSAPRSTARGGMFGSVRLRHFGAAPARRRRQRPLARDQPGERTSRLRVRGRASLVLDVFNLFDVEASDIDYFYTSRLRGEPADGVDDIHTHPALPRSVRVSLVRVLAGLKPALPSLRPAPRYFFVSIALVQMSISSGRHRAQRHLARIDVIPPLDIDEILRA